MLLARFRPTPRQALGRGLYLGGWLAVAALPAAAGLHLAGVLPRPVDSPLPVLAVVLLAPAASGLAGLVLCRRSGTSVDAAGVREAAGRVLPWPDVVDVRAERHGGRIEVRAYLDRGGWQRLSAPYDGRLLAHDPGFEHKYLTLRQVWEAHRSWNAPASA
jgi:hypothetical protein